MTLIDKLIWELHSALKKGNKESIKKVQAELLKNGYMVENSYMVSKLDEPEYVQNININFLEKRFKNVK